MTTRLTELMAASVKIGGPKPGTGYLIASDRIATCHHVVDLWTEGGSHRVEIGYPDPIVATARVISRDKVSDCAILEIEPPVDIQPLALADDLEVQALWEGYGFPHSANGVGIYLNGEVLVPQTKDETGRPVLQLRSCDPPNLGHIILYLFHQGLFGPEVPLVTQPGEHEQINPLPYQVRLEIQYMGLYRELPRGKITESRPVPYVYRRGPPRAPHPYDSGVCARPGAELPFRKA